MDFLICQTSAASPAEPGELLFWFREAAAGVYIEERHRHMLEDNRRQIAEAKKRQREREKREAAEIEAAKEADRKEYAARGWPARG
jgi:hypothetical protein